MSRNFSIFKYASAICFGLLATTTSATSLTPKTLAKLSANTDTVKVVFLGDSITAGCGASNAADGSTTFPAVFASLLASELATYGSNIPVTRTDMRADDPYATSNSPTPAAATANICPAWAGVIPRMGFPGFPPPPSHQIIRQGYGGRTSADILTFLNSTASNAAAINGTDLVVLEIGTNDSAKAANISPSQYVQNVNNILLNLNAKGVKEVLVVNALSNGKWEDAGITSYYDATFNDLKPYNDALAANTFNSTSSMSVKFFDLQSKIVGSLASPRNVGGSIVTLPLISSDANGRRNMYRWASSGYAVDGAKTIYTSVLDILHPNPTGYRAIAEQLFYNTLSRLPDIAAPTVASAGVSTAYTPVAIWVQGSNFTASTRVYLTSMDNKPWSAQLVPVIASGGSVVTFTVPDTIAPDDCNLQSSCNIQINLKDIKTGLSSASPYILAVPQTNSGPAVSSQGINAPSGALEAFWLVSPYLSLGQWGVLTKKAGSDLAQSASPLVISTDGTWASGTVSTLPSGNYDLRIYDPRTARFSPKATITAP